jgi:serine/threonine-protein kinase RsbW
VKDSGRSFVVETDGAVCELLLPATPVAPKVARARLRHWLERQRWPAEQSEEIEYAVSEAVTNAVEHAYPPGVDSAAVGVTAEVDELPAGSRRVRVRVSDSGRWRPIPADPEGRRQGLRLMNGFMDQVVITEGDGVNGGTEVALLSQPVTTLTSGA